MDKDLMRQEVYNPIKHFDGEVDSLIGWAEEEGLDPLSLELLGNVQQSLDILLRHLKQQMGD